MRWALDYKGIAHRRRVLGPDYLIRVWRATGWVSCPFCGSMAGPSPISRASFLEHYPEPLLIRVTPPRGSARSRWSDLDDTLGPALRAARDAAVPARSRHCAARADDGHGQQGPRTLRPLLRSTPNSAIVLAKAIWREIEPSSQRPSIESSTSRQGRAYLVGEAFTVADQPPPRRLGALLQPPEIQYPLQVELPLYLKTPRRAVAASTPRRAAGVYRLHRGYSRRKSPSARLRRSIGKSGRRSFRFFISSLGARKTR